MDRRGFLAGGLSLAVAAKWPARWGSGESVALVTADEESRLVAVDLRSGRVRGYLRTLPKPRSIERVGSTAVVAHSELGAVSIIRSPTLSVAHVLRGFGEPRYTATHPDGRHAYVTDAKRGEVVVVDVAAGRVVGRAHVGAKARHLTIDPAGTRLWISLGAKASQIAVVDIAQRTRPRLVALMAPPFLAHDVGWTPDGARVWVSSGDRNSLAIYNAKTHRLLARPAADRPPQHITFSGGQTYVTSGESATLRVHRSDGHVLRTTAVADDSYNVQQAHGWVVTPALGRGTLCILDTSGRLVHRRQVARSSHDACILVA
jgi:DNA-binding beta-propeller fold protein YncE